MATPTGGGIFAAALRLVLGGGDGEAALDDHGSGMGSAAESVAGAAEADGGAGAGASALAPPPDPVTSAYVRGSVRSAGLSWEALEGDSVLPSRLARCVRLLEGPQRVIDSEALRAAAWSGLPLRYRTAAWQMLLGYLPLQRDRQGDALARRKAEYLGAAAASRALGGSAGRSEGEQALLRQVLVDVPRTCPEVPLFHCEWVQRSLERVLFTYAARHFATGYVQGLNDLATPFYAAFLSPWLDPFTARDVVGVVDPVALGDVEADVYWCLSRLLEGIQDHYTPSQPGIQRMIHRLRELVHRIDEPLVNHLESNGVEFSTFAFRWMNCLLMRELPLPLVGRLWDTYIAEARNGAVRDGFHTFHVYVCAALLLRFSKPVLMGLPTFGELLPFLQKLPTKDWRIADIEELIAQAFVHKTLFEDAKAHLL